MRKNNLFLALAVCACVLSGCGSSTEVSEETAVFEEIEKESDDNGAGTADSLSSADLDSTVTEAENIEENNSDSATTEEVYDGVLGATLLDSGKDLIGTTNDYGVFYSVVYKADFSDDSMTLYGSMNYKNDPAQDAMTVSDDTAHVITTDENTKYYMIGGEDGPEEVSREDFINYFGDCIKVGMYFEVQISDKVATSVSISA